MVVVCAVENVDNSEAPENTRLESNTEMNKTKTNTKTNHLAFK